MTVEEVSGTLTTPLGMSTEGATTASVSIDDARKTDAARPGLIEPRPGGLAERFAARVGATHPVRVFLAAVVSGYLLVAALSVATGLVFVETLLPIGGLEKWDNGLNRDLAEGRTPTLVDASWVGSTLAGGLVIPIVIGVLLVAFAACRQWLLAVFALFLVLVESGTYRATSLVVERDRPPVERLEGLDPTASYPSGHTAAALALYGGLLLLAASWVRRPWFTVLAVALTAGIVLFVAWSRMLRGMHHLTDTIASIGVGVLAVVVVVFAARAATAAARGRRAKARLA
jgi:membrane-associated phospholipid phosphatase